MCADVHGQNCRSGAQVVQSILSRMLQVFVMGSERFDHVDLQFDLPPRVVPLFTLVNGLSIPK